MGHVGGALIRIVREDLWHPINIDNFAYDVKVEEPDVEVADLSAGYIIVIQIGWGINYMGGVRLEREEKEQRGGYFYESTQEGLGPFYPLHGWLYHSSWETITVVISYHHHLT